MSLSCHRARRRATHVVLAACVALVAGCVSIPTSGPIESGDVVVSETGSLVALAADPDPGASPEQIIRGFLSASDAGLYDDFQTARKYLTTGGSSGWDPRARVVVYGSTGPEVEEQEGGEWLVTVPVAATLDREGRFEEATPGRQETFTFELTRSGADQWRVVLPPEGVLVSEPTFDRAFRSTPVYFADRSRTHLVPDVRWFPVRYQATSAVEALLAGPSPWLRDVVVSGAHEGARLSTAAVTVTGGVAEVDLTGQARLAPSADRALLQAQLDATLGRLPGVLVSRVEVTVGGSPLEVRVVPDLLRDPAPAVGPFVVTADGLGLLTGGAVVPVPDAAAVADVRRGGLAASPDGTAVVALTEDGRLVRLLPAGPDGEAEGPGTDEDTGQDDDAEGAGSDGAETGDDGDQPEVSGPEGPRVLADGMEVLPAADPRGWFWTAGPAGLLAVRADGETVAPTADWLVDREVLSIALSRDGARAAVVSRGPEGAPTLDVAGVVRADDTPLGLGPPLTLGAALTDPTRVRWVDESTLAVLAETSAGPEVHLVTVGGRTRALPGVEGAVALVTGRGERSLYVLTDEGDLVLRQNQGWAVVAEEVRAASYG